MHPNPLYWRTTLAGIGRTAGPIDFMQHMAGVPVLGDACPAEVRVPLRAVLRRAFVGGNSEAPLADALADVSGWTSAAAPEPRAPRAQVVVPVRGAHDALGLCLACFDRHTSGEGRNDAGDVNVTLVSGADDGAAVRNALDTCGAFGGGGLCSCIARTVVCTPKARTFAENVNLGASQSRSEFVVLLNSDAFVGPGWLDALLAPFADPEVVAAGPMGTNVSGHQNALAEESTATVADLKLTSERVALATRFFAQRRGELSMTSPYPARRLVGFCVAVRRSAWDRVGGMDERFENAYCDDDLSVRLSLVGKCVVVPDLLVLHEGQASFRELGDAGAYARGLAENEVRFRAKWGWLRPDWDAWNDGRGWR